MTATAINNFNAQRAPESYDRGNEAAFRRDVERWCAQAVQVMTGDPLSGPSGVTVTGTANRISITGTYVIDIAATYVGQTSITTVGTIATGTWQGSVISTTYTQAQVISITGTTNRITIGGTATVPTVDIAVTYIGQNTITTLGTITTGMWGTHLLFTPDNTYDIGANGATRPANAYIASSLRVGDPGSALDHGFGYDDGAQQCLITTNSATLDGTFLNLMLESQALPTDLSEVGIMVRMISNSGTGVTKQFPGLIFKKDGAWGSVGTTDSVTIFGGFNAQVRNYPLVLFAKTPSIVFGSTSYPPTDPGTLCITWATNNAATLGTSALRWSTVYGVTGNFSTSVLSPILDSNAATDLLLKRNGVTQLTLASAVATFLGTVGATEFLGPTLDSGSAVDLVLQRNNATTLTLGAATATVVSGVEIVFAGSNGIRRDTADASDTGYLDLAGGGAVFATGRGAYIRLYGNDEVVNNGFGNLILGAGDAPSAIRMYSAGTEIAQVNGSRLAAFKPVGLKGYTVAGLPTGAVGDLAYVTDALAPAFLTAIVGGGAVKAPVFYDGTNWVAV